jgi:hypothetical protein
MRSVAKYQVGSERRPNSNTKMGRYGRPFVNHEHYTRSHPPLSARVPSCAPCSPSTSTDETASGT